MGATATWHVTTFYRFFPLPEAKLPEMQSDLKVLMTDLGMVGLLLIATEGINGTVAGPQESIPVFKKAIGEYFAQPDLHFKDSVCEVMPFQRVSVDIRREIVGLKRPDLVPESEQNSHLSPKEWHELLSSENPPVVIDTRNTYETVAGKFKGAIDPQITSFSQWGKFLDESQLPPDQPVLIYCTGGIRCEKAILEMHRRGFEKVYQLRDGILGYLNEYPNAHFEGECFVFDERVTVGQHLEHTGTYGKCTGCSMTTENRAECIRCGAEFFVCSKCKDERPLVCTKTCLDRWQRAAGLIP